MSTAFGRLLMVAVGLGVACIPNRVHGCLNDYDSIVRYAEDASPLQIILGYFPQNPKEYYELRIKRLEPMARANTLRISGFDDLAVAYDRIGNSESAITWIRRKADLMKGASARLTDNSIPGAPPPTELTPREYMEYTTHAN